MLAFMVIGAAMVLTAPRLSNTVVPSPMVDATVTLIVPLFCKVPPPAICGAAAPLFKVNELPTGMNQVEPAFMVNGPPDMMADALFIVQLRPSVTAPPPRLGVILVDVVSVPVPPIVPPFQLNCAARTPELMSRLPAPRIDPVPDKLEVFVALRSLFKVNVALLIAKLPTVVGALSVTLLPAVAFIAAASKDVPVTVSVDAATKFTVPAVMVPPLTLALTLVVFAVLISTLPVPALILAPTVPAEVPLLLVMVIAPPVEFKGARMFTIPPTVGVVPGSRALSVITPLLVVTPALIVMLLPALATKPAATVVRLIALLTVMSLVACKFTVAATALSVSGSMVCVVPAFAANVLTLPMAAPPPVATIMFNGSSNSVPRSPLNASSRTALGLNVSEA